jgi:putative ABC transport system permease protein
VGDKIALDGGTGETHTVRIEGFYDFNLTYHELIMGRDYYERVFGTKLVPNVVLADTKGTSVDDLKPALTKIDGFYSISDDKTYQKGNFDTFSGVSSTVVLIYLVLAALMAVVVLLNLNFMFIEEKKRDLIVLMINGFSVHDAKRYIYNDTIVLTAIGIVLGLIVGGIMGAITVGSVEPNSAVFLKGIAWRAMAVGAGGSAILAVVMSMVALRRIPRFNLTDINKA